MGRGNEGCSGGLESRESLPRTGGCGSSARPKQSWQRSKGASRQLSEAPGSQENTTSFFWKNVSAAKPVVLLPGSEAEPDQHSSKARERESGTASGAAGSRAGTERADALKPPSGQRILMYAKSNSTESDPRDSGHGFALAALAGGSPMGARSLQTGQSISQRPPRPGALPNKMFGPHGQISTMNQSSGSQTPAWLRNLCCRTTRAWQTAFSSQEHREQPPPHPTKPSGDLQLPLEKNRRFLLPPGTARSFVCKFP